MKILKLFISLIALVVLFLVSLLQTHVVLDVAGLYGIGFLTQFSFIQMYGIISLISYFKSSYKKEDDDDDDDVIQMVKGTIWSIVHVLVFWGLSYIVYNIIA